jgi:hypothetical protein
MKNALKRKYLAVLLLFALLSTCLFSGCSAGSGYIGSYQSTFVDAQTSKGALSFTLVINRDNTFVLTRCKDGAAVSEFSGYCKSYTEAGKKQLLCVVEEGRTSNSWTPYFSLCKLDDGTVMATAGTTSTNTSVMTAFGSGSSANITLILFDKQ